MDSNLGPPLDSHFSEFFGTNVERYEDEQFNQLDMPGGDDFYDITTIFSEGAEEMDHGSLLMTEGFELQQAMNAFEIGEPRLDTGMRDESDNKLPFNPLTSLLPGEVCWIMDRSFAYEMLWHAGNCLPHSILTIQYVHRLSDMDPELLYLRSAVVQEDPERPLELITVVLRSFMSGLMKCCDFSWRRLNEGSTREMEDWQSDKCEVSFLEGVPPVYLHTKLDEADFWLEHSYKVPQQWREPLRARVRLRNVWLQMLGLDVHKDSQKLQLLLSTAKQHLATIRSHPSPEPSPTSPARLAFDPHLARLLTCSVPLRILDVPPVSETWDSLTRFLDDWVEVGRLSSAQNLATWELAGSLQSYSRCPMPAYLRSTSQLTFYDGLLVLHNFMPSWVVERFFLETMGIRYNVLSQAIRERWKGGDGPPFAEMERHFTKVITPQLQSHWQNVPRRRRGLAKLLLPWHKLYDLVVEMTERLETTDEVGFILRQIPNAVLSWRLSVIREVIFSGFQLDLYTSEERAFAYLYAAQTMEKHISCLEQLSGIVPAGTPTKAEIDFNVQYLTALQLISMALFSVVTRLMSFEPQRLQLNFIRRYKWAFLPEYDSITTPDSARPQFPSFLPACKEILEDTYFSPSDYIRLARKILSDLIAQPSHTNYWHSERIKFIGETIAACDTLDALPSTTAGIRTFDTGLLLWDPTQNHPWFPTLSLQGADQRRRQLARPNIV
ncbi:MAK10 family protein [Pleurotus pulmonarius]